jgi:hypothetical protein
METGPLSAPHPLLERAVAALMPPAAREAVMGDLFELYQSPLQYARGALGALPFVVASQIRRQANIPVLIIQALVVSACFSGLLLSLRQPLAVANIALITAAIMAVMLLSEAYRGDKPASEKQAIFEAIVVGVSVVAYAYYVLVVMLHGNRLYSHQPGWALFFWLILPFGMPALCALRAGSLVGRASPDRLGVDGMSRDDLVRRCQQFEIDARRRNRREIAFLIAAGALSGLILWRAGLKPGLPGLLAAAIYAVAPFYLLLHGAPGKLLPQRDFLSLRNFFQREMTRQHQLRAFTGWLGPAPLLVLLYAMAFRFSSGPTHQLWLVYATMAAMSGFFLVLAIHRDRGAHLQDITNQLDRLRERRPG